ncbi:uncharacterized protein [Apostichopus japonicus]|uniref:uncharacterized protein n=1 Tax=Stichopus japonicus TaxID=307972 RepID=UPI003AB5BCCC
MSTKYVGVSVELPTSAETTNGFSNKVLPTEPPSITYLDSQNSNTQRRSTMELTTKETTITDLPANDIYTTERPQSRTGAKRSQFFAIPAVILLISVFIAGCLLWCKIRRRESKSPSAEEIYSVINPAFSEPVNVVKEPRNIENANAGQLESASTELSKDACIAFANVARNIVVSGLPDYYKENKTKLLAEFNVS